MSDTTIIQPILSGPCSGMYGEHTVTHTWSFGEPLGIDLIPLGVHTPQYFILAAVTNPIVPNVLQIGMLLTSIDGVSVLASEPNVIDVITKSTRPLVLCFHATIEQKAFSLLVEHYSQADTCGRGELDCEQIANVMRKLYHEGGFTFK